MLLSRTSRLLYTTTRNTLLRTMSTEREQEVIENLTEVRKVVAELGQQNNVINNT